VPMEPASPTPMTMMTVMVVVVVVTVVVVVAVVAVVMMMVMPSVESPQRRHGQRIYHVQRHACRRRGSFQTTVTVTFGASDRNIIGVVECMGNKLYATDTVAVHAAGKSEPRLFLEEPVPEADHRLVAC